MPSNQTAALFELVAKTVQQVGITVVVVTLILQFLAKKIITFMWLYYCALQIIILIV